MPYKNPPILNETDDDRLAALNVLLDEFFEADAVINVTPVNSASARDGLNVSIVFTHSFGAEDARSRIPHEYEPSIEVTGSYARVYFTLPYEVAGKHGRVGTYTNHKCKGALCRAMWRQQNSRMRSKRKAKLAAAPRKGMFSYIPLDNGETQVVEHGTDWARANWGCDCADCKAGHARYEHGRRGRAKKAAANPPAAKAAKRPRNAADDNAEIAKILG